MTKMMIMVYVSRQNRMNRKKFETEKDLFFWVTHELGGFFNKKIKKKKEEKLLFLEESK